MSKFVNILLLGTLALNGLLVECALLEKRAAIPLTEPATAASSSSPAFLNTTTSDQSSTLAVTVTASSTVTRTSICQPQSCTGRAKYVSILYWPPESSQTACLVTNSQPEVTTLPSGLKPVSPSVYAIVISITATDGCNTVGKAYDAFTASFDPGEIQTYGPGGVPNTFNFSDLPCGPNGMGRVKGEPYEPFVVAPDSLFDQMGGGYEGCLFNSWLDPSIQLMSVDSADGPFKKSKFKPRGQKREAAPAQALPPAPLRTSEST